MRGLRAVDVESVVVNQCMTKLERGTSIDAEFLGIGKECEHLSQCCRASSNSDAHGDAHPVGRDHVRVPEELLVHSGGPRHGGDPTM